MLKKLIVLAVVIFSLYSYKVEAKFADISTSLDFVILNEVEPLRIDSDTKKYRLVLEDGRIFRQLETYTNESQNSAIPKDKPENTKIKPNPKPTNDETDTKTDLKTRKSEAKKEVEMETKKSTVNKTEPNSEKSNTTQNLSPDEENNKEVESKTDTKKSENESDPIINDEQTISKPKKLSVEEVKALIVKYSEKYQLDSETMLRIAECESKYDSSLIGLGRYYGVFQFSKPTFSESAPKLNFQNPDPLNPEQNIEMASYLFSQGEGWRWGCK